MNKQQKTNQARRILDNNVEGVPKSIPAPRVGWIRAVRESLGMTREQLGQRMRSAQGTKGVSASAVQSLENTEANGTITLDGLARAADAMGCKVVYAIVPMDSFDDIVRQRAADLVSAAEAKTRKTMSLEGENISAALVVDAENLIGTSALWN